MTLDEMVADIRRVLGDGVELRSVDLRVADSRMVLVFGNSFVELRVNMSLYALQPDGWLKMDPAKYVDNIAELAKHTFTVKLEEEPK